MAFVEFDSLEDCAKCRLRESRAKSFSFLLFRLNGRELVTFPTKVANENRHFSLSPCNLWRMAVQRSRSFSSYPSFFHNDFIHQKSLDFVFNYSSADYRFYSLLMGLYSLSTEFIANCLFTHVAAAESSISYCLKSPIHWESVHSSTYFRF